MRQQRKDILFHLRIITTQLAMLLALVEAHFFRRKPRLLHSHKTSRHLDGSPVINALNYQYIADYTIA